MKNFINRARSPIRTLLLALFLLPAETILMTPQTAHAYVAARRGPYGRTAVVVRPGVGRGYGYYGRRAYYYGARPYYYGRRPYYYGARPYYYGANPYYYGRGTTYYSARPYYYGGARRVARRTSRRVVRRYGY